MFRVLREFSLALVSLSGRGGEGRGTLMSSQMVYSKINVFFSSFAECEHLIRHMLVKDPNQRYTIEQIKKHKWMQADPAVKTILAFNEQENFDGEKILDEYNEQALELMHGLGIDIERTKKVKHTFSFDVLIKTATPQK